MDGWSKCSVSSKTFGKTQIQLFICFFLSFPLFCLFLLFLCIFHSFIADCCRLFVVSTAFFEYKEDGGRFPNPPSYNVATTLPSYDEAERSKAEAAVPLVPGRVSDEDFVARDDFEDADQLRIGNDGIFMLTFFMAFLFNWIGFFLSFCLTTSAAGRYGAISGFGLSLIKWVLIVRFSTYFPGYFDGQYWLWWVFLALGFMLFIRGFVNYSRVRKLVDPTYANLPRTRVLFIY
uniref:Nedd4 family interacting protein 1 n=1 Tax=Nothobranchius furzeri TaxID=105023 RepID=A0A8C6KLH6_NOTFU